MDPPASSSSSSIASTPPPPPPPFTSRPPPPPAPPQFGGGFLSSAAAAATAMDDAYMIAHAGSFDFLHMPPPPPSGSRFEPYLYSPKPLLDAEMWHHHAGTSSAAHATNLPLLQRRHGFGAAASSSSSGGSGAEEQMASGSSAMAHDMDCPGSSASSSSSSSSSSSAMAAAANSSSLQPPTPFLTKTFELVDDPSTNDIVSWNSDGNSMIIWNPQLFCLHLLPRYFKHNNLSSFVRQLNTYGFRKVDPERWEFANDGFRQGQPHLLRGIHRRKPSQQQAATAPPHMPAHLQHRQRQEEQWRMLCRPSSSSAVIEVGNFGLQEEIEQLRRDKNVLLMEAIRLRQHLDASERELQDMWLRLQSTERQQLHMITFLARIMNNLHPFSLTHHLLRQQQHNMYLNLPVAGLHHLQSPQPSQLLPWPNTTGAAAMAADSDPPDVNVPAPDPIPIEVQHDEPPIPLLCCSPSAVTGPSASLQCHAAAADEGISSSSSSSSSASRWPWMAGYNRVPEFGSSSLFTEPPRVACTEQGMCSTTADPENQMHRLSSAGAAAAVPSVSSALGMAGGEQEQNVIRNRGIGGGRRSLIGQPLTVVQQQQVITDDPPAQAQEDETGAFWELLLGDGHRQQQP